MITSSFTTSLYSNRAGGIKRRFGVPWNWTTMREDPTLINLFFGVDGLNDERATITNLLRSKRSIVLWDYGACEPRVRVMLLNIPEMNLLWEEAEAKAKYHRYSLITGVAEYWREKAVEEWTKLEENMTWQKGATITDFRRRYIEWLSRATEIDVELGITDLVMEDMPMVDRMITLGYRALAMSEHPDRGGSAERFHKVREAKEKLDKVLREVKNLL